MKKSIKLECGYNPLRPGRRKKGLNTENPAGANRAMRRATLHYKKVLAVRTEEGFKILPTKGLRKNSFPADNAKLGLVYRLFMKLKRK